MLATISAARQECQSTPSQLHFSIGVLPTASIGSLLTVADHHNLDFKQFSGTNAETLVEGILISDD